MKVKVYGAYQTYLLVFVFCLSEDNEGFDLQTSDGKNNWV